MRIWFQRISIGKFLQKILSQAVSIDFARLIISEMLTANLYALVKVDLETLLFEDKIDIPILTYMIPYILLQGYEFDL